MNTILRYVVLCCAVSCSVAQDAGTLAAEPVAKLTVQCSTDTPHRRISSDGRWMVLTDTMYRDAERGTWSFRRVTLIDLDRGRVSLVEPRAFPGRAAPVFSRDGKWLAWVNGVRPDRVVLTRIALGDELDVEERQLEIDVSERVFPSVCAVDRDHIVLFDGGSGRHAERLLVYDIAERKLEHEVSEFREPGMGLGSFQVVLATPHLFSHTRPADRASGGAYRLRWMNVRDGATRGEFGAYVSNATERFVVSNDGERMWNGTGGFDVEEVDLNTGEVTELLSTRDVLYSHFLELTVSPDERFVIAWSRERTQLVCWDRVAGRRIDVPLDRGANVLGVDAASEHVLLGTRHHGVTAVRLSEPHGEHDLIPERNAFAQVTSTGRRAITGRTGDAGHLELQVWQLVRR